MNETQQAPIRLTTPMIVLPNAKNLMERHGCRVGVGTVSLPIGSTRTQRLEIVTLTIWYDIVLPDSYQLLEAYDHQRQLSILYLQPDDVMTMERGSTAHGKRTTTQSAQFDYAIAAS